MASAHAHAPTHGLGGDNARRLFWAMILTAAFMVAEVVGGVVSGSLALLADAGHMLTDTAALALGWLGFRAARKPADERRSYGYHRFQVLAAFVNGAALLAIVVWIGVEAVRRLLEPTAIEGPIMLVVAVAGLAVNGGALVLLRGGDHDNLNIRGASLHVLGDLLGSVAVIVAAAVVLATGWTPIDPLLSLVVALLIVRSAWEIVRRSTHILLEGTPEELDVERLRRELVDAVPGVEDVHHVHAWSLTPERPLVTLHADVREGADTATVLHAIKAFLAKHFGIRHATVQIERGGCADEPPSGAAHRS